MKYRKGYKYQLARNEHFDVPLFPKDDINTDFIYLGAKGSLIIWKGYAWDGCSGPTIDDKTNVRASLAHDALYQLMRQGHVSLEYRKTVDEVLYLLCLQAGMWKIRAKYYHWAVRKFGAPAADPKNKKKVYEAP